MGCDFLDIITFHAVIPNLLRIQHDVRTGLATPKTHVWPYFDVAAGLQFFRQAFQKFTRPTLFAILVLTNQNVAASHSYTAKTQFGSLKISVKRTLSAAFGKTSSRCFA